MFKRQQLGTGDVGAILVIALPAGKHKVCPYKILPFYDSSTNRFSLLGKGVWNR
jgi:hypothetical protein